MTSRELVMNMLAELSTKGISESQNPETFTEHADVARQGGEIARNARVELEAKTGKPVVSSMNAKRACRLARRMNRKQKDNFYDKKERKQYVREAGKWAELPKID